MARAERKKASRKGTEADVRPTDEKMSSSSAGALSWEKKEHAKSSESCRLFEKAIERTREAFRAAVKTETVFASPPNIFYTISASLRPKQSVGYAHVLQFQHADVLVAVQVTGECTQSTIPELGSIQSDFLNLVHTCPVGVQEVKKLRATLVAKRVVPDEEAYNGWLLPKLVDDDSRS
jgi:hypothetical protein